MSHWTDTTAEKINFAIQDCLSECRVSHDPLACLAGFLEHLRDLQQWPEAAIHEVDIGVRHLLVPVMNQSALAEESDFATGGKRPWDVSDMAQLRPD
jgi:hypothetical protein